MEKQITTDQQQEVNLSHKDVTCFLAKGIVKDVKYNKSYEIEAKIKKFSGSQSQGITEQQFLNAENQMKMDTQNQISKDNSNLIVIQNSQNKLFYQNYYLKKKVQSQFLLSFSFEDGYRMTFDVYQKQFFLEWKEENTEENTKQVVSQDVKMNISRKKETIEEDQQVVNLYLKKLKNNEYKTIRIKVRKTYTEDFLQRCFSKVIQIQNIYKVDLHKLSQKQILYQSILSKAYCFLENYFSNKTITVSLNNIFSNCFDVSNRSIINYEIEIEIVSINEYFSEMVQKLDQKAIYAKIHKFYESINSIISSLNKENKLHPFLFNGGYSTQD